MESINAERFTSSLMFSYSWSISLKSFFFYSGTLLFPHGQNTLPAFSPSQQQKDRGSPAFVFLHNSFVFPCKLPSMPVQVPLYSFTKNFWKETQGCEVMQKLLLQTTCRTIVRAEHSRGCRLLRECSITACFRPTVVAQKHQVHYAIF